MTTPLHQVAAYLLADKELNHISDEAVVLITSMIEVEADHLLTEVDTKEERRKCLDSMPPLIRQDVERRMMIMWHAQKNRP